MFTAAVVTVTGETLVIVSGAAPGILKLAVPSTCPVSEYEYGLAVPPAAKSSDHPAKLSPLEPSPAVNMTVPLLKNASKSPADGSFGFTSVPPGEDVTVSMLSLFDSLTSQYN